MKTIEINAIEFDSAGEAIQYTDAAGWGRAITVAGKVLVAREEEVERLAAAGVAFAYLCDHEMPDGTHRIMTVPVNDDD